MNDLEVQPGLTIPADELETTTSRSGGPGGQHVNTTESRVTLSWDIGRSRVLGDAQRARLLHKLASRLAGTGVLQVSAEDHRSQLRNRETAALRLAELVRAALVVQKARKPTRPSKGAVERRLKEKKAAGESKRGRGPGSFD